MDLARTETLQREGREPDRPPPGGVAEMPGNIYRYVLAASGWHQLVLVGLTVAVFLLEVVPLMQGAMNRRTRARVQILRQLSVSVVESAAGDDARRDRSDDEGIEQVFELNMGIYRFKFTMNFLMNLSTQLQIIGALLVGGWAVYEGRLEIGGVVAFISGIGRITDPWGDLVNYFREVNLTQVKYALVRDAIHQQAQGQAPDES